MDEAQLKKILENMDTPEPDQNAKKRAVNLAMAEFEQTSQEKSKKFQGFGILARLMGNNNLNDRSNSMEKRTKKRFIYGGTATALAIVLMTGVSYMQLEEKTGTLAVQSAQEVNVDAADFSVAESKSVPVPIGSPKGRPMASADSTASNKAQPLDRWRRMQEERLPSAPGTSEASQAYTQAIENVNRQNAESAVRSSQSSAPIPMGQAKRKITSGNTKFSDHVINEEDPLTRWRAMQEERLALMKASRDKFEGFKVNPIKLVSAEPVSTFSVDVDTASYSFMRRQLNNGVLPQKDSIRAEELINYFDYSYPLPESREQPFKPTVVVTGSPWAEGKKLMHIGIKGFDVQGERPKSNLVFLLDTSGSMNAQDKLPLVKNSLKLMLDNMNDEDTISIVAYAGSAGTVLEPTKASEKGKIIAALDRLSSGGSTAGGAGINLAYQLAEQSFDKDAVNRVILATDGDFNVGIRDREELKNFVERKRDTGIFLSVLGFGQGNYNDHMMQTLAQNGNGVAAYIDNLNEARKLLVQEATSSLFTIAKDVKIQVEFNPKTVAEYRLVGYETRALQRQDFNNDKVDAGDIGAGHTVTAIYEITPVDSENKSVDPLRYGDEVDAPEVNEDFSGEYAFLKVRYKLPKEDKSKLLTTSITGDNQLKKDDMNSVSTDDVQFATAVAGFAQLLKGGEHTGDFTYDDVVEMASEAKGDDPFGYRAEFVNLVRLAESASDM